jgi:hypothetical protein
MKKLLFVLAALGIVVSPVLACDELGELRRAMSEAQANSKETRRAASQRAYAQAVTAANLLDQVLDQVYFPGLYQLSYDPIEITVGGDAAYQAVSARLGFLRGTPGSKIQLAAADRDAQFAALKEAFRSSLMTAADILREIGDAPAADQKLSSLSQWGVEALVTAQGKEDAPILTRAQREAMLTPAPAPQRDPHE